jgi:carbonic anhydrase
VTVTPPDWAFTGDRGPEFWADLQPGYARCASGRRQSPIDLGSANPGRRGDLAVSYHFNKLTVVDLHWTLQVLAVPGGLMSYRGVQHDLVELHFHVPAEHTIAGSQAALEAHFVHQAPDRSLSVIAVLFDADRGTHVVDDLITAFPDEPGGVRTFERLRDIQRIIPLSSPRYRYEGSRTTPPCGENVSWIVMSEHRNVGHEALTAFAERYAPNNRPTQPINDREVTFG